MAKYNLMLHASVTVEAASLNIAKAVAEGRASLVAGKEDTQVFGAYNVTVTEARAAEVKGPRRKTPEKNDLPLDRSGPTHE